MLTSAQIVALATQISKTPGMIQQAGQLLNARLVQLALQQDLDIIRRTTTINAQVGQPSYNLPANYLRAREVFYFVSGEPFNLSARSLEDYDHLFQGTGLQDYPYLYATDIAQNPPLLYLYPSPSTTLTVTVRYMDNLVEITTPENSSLIPWYQDQLGLINMLAEDLMSIADDTRAQGFAQKNDEAFRRMLRMANDSEGRALTVQKDPKRFRAVQAVRPTKLQGD
jgi:hypothetical protein